MNKFNQIIQSIQSWFTKLTESQKRNLALVCTVAAAGLLTVSVLVSMGRSSGGEIEGEPARLEIIAPISAEDLFIPDEPDYLPGVILGREQRSVWTEEDAGEHWQDPLRQGEQQWREKIEITIDEFLERVP